LGINWHDFIVFCDLSRIKSERASSVVWVAGWVALLTLPNKTQQRPNAIIGHSYWGRGGAEVVAMWTIAALVFDFKLTVFTRGGFDLDELNLLAGTAISPNEIDVQIVSRASLMPFGVLAHVVYLRSLKQVGWRYDLCITASGVMAWGSPALHFISSATLTKGLSKKYGSQVSLRLLDVRQCISSMLIAFFSKKNYEPLDNDIFVVNSQWTKQHSRPHSQQNVRVVYPPATFSGDNIEWEEREDVVLVFGRIVREKQIESCIRIVELARSRGFRGRLVIAGSSDEKTYAASIAELCAERPDWVELLSAQVGQAKAELLGRVRYGLSACEIEAFGIATAEMTLAGALVVVPRNCGQAEIVADTRLQYDTESEAAERLVALQQNPSLRVNIQTVMSHGQNRFSPEQYMQNVRDLAQEMLDANLSKARISQ